MKIKVGLVKDIKEGCARVVFLPDGEEIALFNIKGKILAINNECPHEGAPLDEGEVEDCKVTCPWHGWEFDLVTGACLNVEGEQVKVYPVEVKEGEIYLER